MPALSIGDGSPLESDVLSALTQFGFAPPEIESVRRMPQRVKNVNFRVRAGGGDWILKTHRAGAAERLASTQRLELALAESDFPVARLRRSASGETIVTGGTGVFTLHSWVEGQQISIAERDDVLVRRPDLPRDLGSALGTMHRLSTAALGAPTVSGSEVHRLLAGPRGSVTSIRRGRPPRMFKALRLRLRPHKSAFDCWIVDRLPELYRRAGILASASLAARFDPADAVLAHNDLNWENLVFDPEFLLCGVLDFDNAAPLPRLLEVGAAAAVLVGGDQSRLDDFLAGYATAYGRAPVRDDVQLGMHWKCMRSTLWSIDSYLSGRVADPALVATWCHHLYDCMVSLPPIPPPGG